MEPCFYALFWHDRKKDSIKMTVQSSLEDCLNVLKFMRENDSQKPIKEGTTPYIVKFDGSIVDAVGGSIS